MKKRAAVVFTSAASAMSIVAGQAEFDAATHPGWSANPNRPP